MCSTVTSTSDYFRGRFEAQVQSWKGFEELTCNAIVIILAGLRYFTINYGYVFRFTYIDSGPEAPLLH